MIRDALHLRTRPGQRTRASDKASSSTRLTHIINTLFRQWVSGDRGGGSSGTQHTSMVTGSYRSSSSAASASGFTGMDADILNEGNANPPTTFNLNLFQLESFRFYLHSYLILPILPELLPNPTRSHLLSTV